MIAEYLPIIWVICGAIMLMGAVLPWFEGHKLGKILFFSGLTVNVVTLTLNWTVGVP